MSLQLFESIPAASGIYAIVSSIKGRIYVGSAVSLKRRFNEHKKLLSDNKHTNRYLQNDYNQNNNSLRFKVLELVADSMELLAKEQNWLDRSYDNQNRCYNICPTAGSHIGMKHTEETKKKMSVAAKGKPKSKEHCLNNRLVKQQQIGKATAQYSLDGNLLDVYPAIKAASRETGIASADIVAALKGKRCMAGGFLWSHDQVSGEKLSKQYLAMKEKEAMRKAQQFQTNNPKKTGK